MTAIRHVHGLRTLESRPEKSCAQVTLALVIPERVRDTRQERTPQPLREELK
jgi:hypothetical protein